MRKLLWIIIILAIIIGGFWLWSIEKEGSPSTEMPGLDEVSETDTTTQIQLDLDGINLGDIETEFQNIDADLNNL